MLELKDVEFTYPGAEGPAVTNISLRLPIGSSVGIVGQSGAGKSTLIDIFLGLLTPSKGTMTLDGVPLEEVLADWRKRVGYVPQDVAIFDGSVAQNVALSWGGDIDEEKSGPRWNAPSSSRPSMPAPAESMAGSASVAWRCPAVSASAWASPVHCIWTLWCWCSTRPPVRWTRPRKPPSRTRSANCTVRSR